MTKNFKIRQATADDYDAIAEVMYDAVRHGFSAYSKAQRQAWVPQPRSGVEWVERLDSQTVFIAENSNQVVGFISLAENGYIDFAYIRPSAQGSGVFRCLYDTLENQATQDDTRRLWVHASVMAQPAFAAMGFSIIQKETVEIGGQSFERFEMEKHNAAIGQPER